MSHVPLDHVEMGKSVMTAVEVIREEALPKLTEIIDGKSEHERLIILCENKNCRKLVLMLLKQKLRACIFLDDMCEEAAIVAQEKDRFAQVKVAVCSFKAMMSMNLPLVENYVFWELPKPKKYLLKVIIDSIENAANKENRAFHIDFMFSEQDDVPTNQALYIEFKNRDAEVPVSLETFAVNNFATPEVKKKYFEKLEKEEMARQTASFRSAIKEFESASDTTGSTMSSFISNNCEDQAPSTSQPQAIQPKKKVSVEPYDIWNMKPNAEGKYILPASAFDSDGDSDYGQEDENDNYDYEYEYNSYDDEHEYDI